jgi:hypothetical protein
MNKLFYFSLAAASISFTISETKLFKPFRGWIKSRSRFLGELFSCGYCLGHWVSFALAALYRPRIFYLWQPLDYFLTALVIAWLAAFQWIVLALLMEKAGK